MSITVLIVLPRVSVAQQEVVTKGATPLARAKNLFDIGDYKNAFPEYIKLLSEDPESVFLNWRVGLCHLHQNINKARAIPYLRRVTEKSKFDDEVLYDMGLAYMYNEQIDSALYFFNLYRSKATKPERIIDVIRQIEFSENARKFMSNPLNVTFENLGPKVNSPGPDMHPFVPLDESFLVFSTKREKGVAGQNLDYDGYKPPDVFWSKLKKGNFSKVKGVGMTINTEFVEELVGMSAYGEHVFYMIDNMEGYEDIWMTEFTGRRWEKGKTLGESVNTEEPEMAATCTPDAQTLFIARLPIAEPGFGGLDIYMSKRLPGGNWSLPVNLGPTINTQYDEMFPIISADGKTLHFASQGHKSMGGYDVYKSEWNEQFSRWERPVNLGYPINTTMDNFTYCPTDNPRHAYTAQLRKNGFGDLDLYRIIFNDEEQQMTAIVMELEILMGEEKETITIHEWKDLDHDGVIKWFSDEYQPKGNPRFEFSETKEVTIKNGEAFDVIIIGSVDGGDVQKFTPKNFPKDNPSFIWRDTRVKKIKIPMKKVEPTVSSIKGLDNLDISITVTDQVN
ncbi:MAG: PD40 domain-containing protein, partial [Flavobacteriales bacterium]|nr:PD40 domain-containing protein [Flavobacteriales bacterium]